MPAPKQARSGIPLDKATADKLDPKRVARTRKGEPGDVSGQYDAWVTCPYCGVVCYVVGLDPEHCIPFACWNCGAKAILC